MKRLALIGCVLAQAVTVAAFFAYAVIASHAAEAYIIAKNDDKKIEFNREMFNPRASNESEADYRYRVMEIYGNRVEYTTAVVFVPPERFLHPKELESLTLLPVDLSKNETPLQVKSVWFFTKYVLVGSEVAFVALVCLYLLLSRSAVKRA